MTTGISVSKVTVTNTMTNIVTVAPENDANTACMTYILPSLLAVIGVLVGLVIVTATAMFLYIRCSQNKHDIVSYQGSLTQLISSLSDHAMTIYGTKHYTFFFIEKCWGNRSWYTKSHIWSR